MPPPPSAGDPLRIEQAGDLTHPTSSWVKGETGDSAADAKESTAIRETHQVNEEIFRIPECAY
jgi:hypothetical protein